MRSAPLLIALALVACDAKDAAKAPKTTPTPTSNAPELAAAKPSNAAATPAAAPAAQEALPSPNDVIIDHQVKLLDGRDKSLADYRGKALLVVNTASECGYTPQYAGLQQLYAKYKGKGLEVLAFPSNDYGAQEPGDAEQIRTFVDDTYSVEFTMFDKIVTKGPAKAPLYRALTEQTAEGIKGDVEWNFTKFLVDPQGRVVQRFASGVEPDDPALVRAIERVLPKA